MTLRTPEQIWLSAKPHCLTERDVAIHAIGIALREGVEAAAKTVDEIADRIDPKKGEASRQMWNILKAARDEILSLNRTKP